MDIFAWSAYKAYRVDLNFICHHLNVNPNIVLKKQPPQHSFREHVEAVKEKVIKLKCAGAIKEIFFFFSKWLANTVVVKKKNGKWQVCVNFTDLNKTCTKDPFWIPQIDQLVDVTVGHPQINFLDVFQGYH